MRRSDPSKVLEAANQQASRAQLTTMPQQDTRQEASPTPDPVAETVTRGEEVPELTPPADSLSPNKPSLRDEIIQRATSQTTRYVEMHGKRVLADIHEQDKEVSMIARVPLGFRNVVQEYAKELGMSQNQFVIEGCQLMISTIREARGE